MSPRWAPWWVGTKGDESDKPPGMMMMETETPPANANVFEMKEKRFYKRRKTDQPYDSEVDSESSDEESQRRISAWPRFLVVESTDQERSLAKLSPFAIEKAIQGLAGKPKDVKKLSSGSLLVIFDERKYSENLLKSKTFANIPVKVSPHTNLNKSKGVVRDRDLKHATEDEIQEGLSTRGRSKEAANHIGWTKDHN